MRQSLSQSETWEDHNLTFLHNPMRPAAEAIEIILVQLHAGMAVIK